MTKRRLEFVLFDMIGTTIKDSVNGDSLIMDCFRKAFSINGFQVNYPEINQQRGKSKKESVINILNEQKQPNVLADKVYFDFIELLTNSLISLTEIDGTTNVFKLLKRNGIMIGLGSGLPMDLIIRIINKVGWQPGTFDYIGSSDELGIGRPDPIMIDDSLMRLNIRDRSRVLKIGDTFVDIQEGKNAGVLTAGVLTGTQKKEELEKYNPDYIFSNIKEIMTII